VRAAVSGHVNMLISVPPCVSCLGVIRQVQLLFSCIELRISGGRCIALPAIPLPPQTMVALKDTNPTNVQFSHQGENPVCRWRAQGHAHGHAHGCWDRSSLHQQTECSGSGSPIPAACSLDSHFACVNSTADAGLAGSARQEPNLLSSFVEKSCGADFSPRGRHRCPQFSSESGSFLMELECPSSGLVRDAHLPLRKLSLDRRSIGVSYMGIFHDLLPALGCLSMRIVVPSKNEEASPLQLSNSSRPSSLSSLSARVLSHLVRRKASGRFRCGLDGSSFTLCTLSSSPGTQVLLGAAQVLMVQGATLGVRMQQLDAHGL